MNKKESTIGEPMKTLKDIHDGKTDMYEAFIIASKAFRDPVFTNKVSYGKTNFEYANLSEIIDCIKSPLLINGFYVVHDFIYNEDTQLIKTYLQYKNGNTLGYITFPIIIRNKTMQEIAAQITYLKRYSLSSLCNLFADSDNDAKEVEGQRLNETISAEQIKELEMLLDQLPSSEQIGLLKWCQVKDVPLIPKSKFMAAKNTLKAKIEKGDNNE